MSFGGIVGQRRATEALAAAVREHRLFPSLVFHGPAGAGKLSTALALCRALLCASSSDLVLHDGCPACRRIDERSLLHPDVRVIFPETLSDFERGEEAPEGSSGIDLQERQAEAIANPAWSILIDRVRQTIRFVHRRPVEGARSILVVDQAHRLGAEAANSLLKTLEEPPAHAVVILLASSYHALLPTIRSRCQAVPFQLVPSAEITAFLTERRAIDPGEAALRAGLSGGRIGTALHLELAEFRSRRDSLLKIFEGLLESGDPGFAVARAEELVRGGDTLDADLEIAMTLLRDLMILSAAPRAPLLNLDLGPRLQGLAPRLGDRGPRVLLEMEEAIDGIRRKGNRQLLVENVLLGLAGARAAETARRIG